MFQRLRFVDLRVGWRELTVGLDCWFFTALPNFVHRPVTSSAWLKPGGEGLGRGLLLKEGNQCSQFKNKVLSFSMETSTHWIVCSSSQNYLQNCENFHLAIWKVSVYVCYPFRKTAPNFLNFLFRGNLKIWCTYIFDLTSRRQHSNPSWVIILNPANTAGLAFPVSFQSHFCLCITFSFSRFSFEHHLLFLVPRPCGLHISPDRACSIPANVLVFHGAHHRGIVGNSWWKCFVKNNATWMEDHYDWISFPD